MAAKKRTVINVAPNRKDGGWDVKKQGAKKPASSHRLKGAGGQARSNPREEIEPGPGVQLGPPPLVRHAATDDAPDVQDTECQVDPQSSQRDTPAKILDGRFGTSFAHRQLRKASTGTTLDVPTEGVRARTSDGLLEGYRQRLSVRTIAANYDKHQQS